MSMADDNTLRPYRSSDPYRRAAEPLRPSEEASARDPLAELARLLGQSDPFADLGRSHSRQGQQEAHDAPATAPDDWQGAPAREPQFAAAGDAQRGWGQESSQGSSHAASRDYTHSPAPQPEDGRSDSRFYDELHLGADQQTQHYGDQTGDGQHDAQVAEHYYEDDAPLDPHDDAMYDDAPRARRGGGLATALALIGCAMLGTAGAYAYPIRNRSTSRRIGRQAPTRNRSYRSRRSRSRSRTLEPRPRHASCYRRRSRRARARMRPSPRRFARWSFVRMHPT